MDTEAIRQRYKPKQVRLLLVGESPPASGKFFYVDSAMTKHTRSAFEKAEGIRFKQTAEFLEHFKERGCFLEDLSHTPVDRLPKEERERRLRKEVESFSKRIKVINPSVVVIVLRKIERYVRDAVSKSGRAPEIHTLPFPGNGHQIKYIDGLEKILAIHVQNET